VKANHFFVSENCQNLVLKQLEGTKKACALAPGLFHLQ